MIISYNWLRQFIENVEDLEPEKIGEELKMKTVEVEKVETKAKSLEKVVVGKILRVEVHPDADRLKVCLVDVGDEKLKIVCGGSNLSENMNVVVAKLGAKVKWHGEGEPIEMVRAKIRGVESEGMICAADEVGIVEMFPKKSEKEIVDLGDVAVSPGTPLSEFLGWNDVSIEVDNKSMSHRPDLWGHYGLAREVAAIFKKDLRDYKTKKIKEGNEFDLRVEVKDKNLCPRYMAVAIAGVKVEASPKWLKEKLEAVGVRPINNIVDITNYLMLELGQPMHAFDAERLNSKKIIVREALGGEKIKALDGNDYALEKGMLVIADEEKALAIAGIMGGENSGVRGSTTTIIFESATFSASLIRKTSTKLGLRTDSSARFEKSLDPLNAQLALEKAVEITLQLCPAARVTSKLIDINNYQIKEKKLELPLADIQKKIGVDIAKAEAVDILERLGFETKEKNAVLQVRVPSWRATKDISIPEDLIEEIVRIYGFNNVPASLPLLPIVAPEENKLRKLERRIKEILIAEFSFLETYNYSFDNEEWLKRLLLPLEGALRLDNPVAKDRPLLRQSLLPNLLQAAESNLHKTDELRIFEVERVFTSNSQGPEDGSGGYLPEQHLMLGMLYAKKGECAPFFVLADAVKRILEKNNIKFRIRKEDEAGGLWHPGRAAIIEVAGQKVGVMGELNPVLQEKVGIEPRAAMLELDVEKILDSAREVNSYKPISAFPGTSRDVAFVVDKNVTNAEIVNALQRTSNLIVGVELFDVFAGKNVQSGKKSLAYHISYESPERTLESAEVDEIQNKIFHLLAEKFQAEIRK